jgi:hypothetical protein
MWATTNRSWSPEGTLEAYRRALVETMSTGRGRSKGHRRRRVARPAAPRHSAKERQISS